MKLKKLPGFSLGLIALAVGKDKNKSTKNLNR